MKITVVLLALGLGLFFRCKPLCALVPTNLKVNSAHGQLFGSTYSLQLRPTYPSSCPIKTDSLVRRFENDFIKNLSTYDPTSRISLFNQGITSLDSFDYPYAQLFSLAKLLHRISSGIYDASIYPLRTLWQRFLKGDVSSPPTKQQLQSVLSAIQGSDWQYASGMIATNHSAQRTNQQLQFDLDSIAPGLALDLLARELWSHGCAPLLLEIGGEVIAYGEASFLVGIESPNQLDTHPVYQVQLKNLAIGTSGLARKGRFYQGKWYSSFIDARSGENINSDLLQVSVAHPQGAMADGLATVMMLLGAQKAWNLAQELKLPLLLFLSDERTLGQALANSFWVQKLPTTGPMGHLLPHEKLPALTPGPGL